MSVNLSEVCLYTGEHQNMNMNMKQGTRWATMRISGKKKGDREKHENTQSDRDDP